MGMFRGLGTRGMRALHFMLPAMLLVTSSGAWAANERDIDFDWITRNLDKIVKQFLPSLSITLSNNDGDGNGIKEDDSLAMLGAVLRNNTGSFLRVNSFNATDAANIRADFVANRTTADNDMQDDSHTQPLIDVSAAALTSLLNIGGMDIPNCKLTTILKADEALGTTMGTFVGTLLLDLIGGIVTVGDNPASFTYVNGILDNLLDTAGAQLSTSWGLIANSVKQDMRITTDFWTPGGVQTVYSAASYGHWGASPGGPAGPTRRNVFGSAGDFDQQDWVTNGTFTGTSGWTTGAGWTLSGTAASATTATSSTTQASSITVGKAYTVTYTVTRSAGSVRINLGTANGTTRSAAGTFTETITAAGNTTIAIEGIGGFTGTVDNLTVTTTNQQEYNFAGSDREAFLRANLVGVYSSQTTDQPIRFTVQPPANVYAAGTVLNLSPTFTTGNAGPLSYQWEDAQDFGDKDSPYASDYGLKNIVDAGFITGSQSATLSISDLTYADHNGIKPWLRVSDQVNVYNTIPVGNGTPSGAIAADGLGGKTSTYGWILVAETLPRGPINTVCSGSVTLNAFASAAEDSTDGDTDADAPTYQWVYGVSSGSLSAIGGQTTSSYTFTASGPNEGYYACDTTVYINGAFKTTRTNVVFFDFPATPAAPAVPDLAAVSDSGTFNNDDLTNVQLPTFTGTADSNTTVTLVVDGNPDNTTTASVSGAWSMTPLANLSEGNHTIAAYATNCAGTGATGSALTITIDTTAPSTPSQADLATADDSGSSNSDDITSVTTPLLSGTADAGTTVSVTSSLNGIIGTSTGPNWSITSSALSDGTHNITASATDVAGNTSASSTPLTVVIDTLAPNPPTTPDLTAAKDSGSSNSDNITNIANPSFTGTAESGAVVRVFSDIAGQIATGIGPSYTANSGSLSTVVHQITATATDAAGNTSAASGALTLNIDQSAPAAPSIPDLNAASDSGTSNSDDVTNVTLPSFSGTAEANTTVTLLVDNVANGTVSSGGSGSFTTLTALAALAQGPRNISARATDLAGNTGAASGTLTVTVDTTAPAQPGLPDLLPGSDTGISSTDNDTSDTTPDLSGTAESGAIMTVTSSIDGTIGTPTATGGTWNLTPALTENIHSITVTARDAAGNTSIPSSALGLTIDVTAPPAPGTPDLTTLSDTGVSSSDDITNDTTPDITGSATSGFTVQLTSSITGAIGSGLSAGTYTITSTTLAAGGHVITAKQTDLAGNQSAASGGLSITVDTTAPTISGKSPAAGTTLASLPTVQVTTSEAVSGLTAGKLTVNGSAATTVTGTNPYDFSGYAVPADGTVNIAVNVSGVTDTAGNALSATGNSWTYTKNSSIPTVALTTPTVVDGGITNAATVTFTATFSEPVQNFVVGDINVTGGTPGTFAGGPTVYTFVVTPSGQGAISVTIPAAVCTGVALPLARDNTASNTYDYTFDSIAPTVTVASTSTNQNRPALSGTVNDNTASISVQVGPQNVAALNNGDGTWTLAANVLAAIADGTYNVTVTATDAASNAGTDATTNELTIDTTAPTVTVVTISTNDSTPALGGTVNDPTATISVTVGAQNVAGTNTGLGTWVLADNTLTALADGTYNVIVTATDTLGNAASDATTSELFVDTTPPVLTVNDALTADNTPSLSGTVDDTNATVTVQVGAQTVPATNLGNGNWSLADDQLTALADGVHEVIATGTDSLGNSAVDSTSNELTVDTTGPVITINGTSPTLVNCGAGYTDDGATAEDARQGTVTGDIVATGDTSFGTLQIPGDYFVTYNVADSLGNDATPVVRTVTVVGNCPLDVVVAETSATRDEGEDYTFSAAAVNPLGPVTLQWQKYDDINGWQDFGSQGGVLTIALLVLSDTGLYRCEAVDAVATAYSDEVTLTVNPADNLPVAGLAGLGIASLLAALTGAAATRRKR